MKNLQIPEGMRNAFYDGYNEPEPSERVTDSWSPVESGLKAALKWLRENPIEPSPLQCKEVWSVATNRPISFLEEEEIATISRGLMEWERRMFLTSKAEEMPEDLHPLRQIEDRIRGVKRFDFNPHDGEVGMEESADGDYIRYRDMVDLLNNTPKENN